jgi:N-carbamoyl-L-amino-acid hydrolase
VADVSWSGLRVDEGRLWSRLMDMARYGATAAGGCNRQALTDEDKGGRDLFVGWCREAGCEIRIDQIGNIFARRASSDNSLPPVITGSHLDTQPSGGKFDGIYGVLAGLEVIEVLNDAGITTIHPLEIVVWTNEDGCRFDTAMMGSAVWSGAMALEDAYALVDREGSSVKSELERIAYLGDTPAALAPVHAAFELHIEQGPVLEAQGKSVGVVTGVQHMSRHRIFIDGVEAHAGPTPMTMRKDPMMALSKFLPQLYQMAEQHGPDGRITFGFIDARPGSANTVPGRLELTVDIRHPDAESYAAMLHGFSAAVRAACESLDLGFEINCFWEAPGVAFDPECIAAVRSAVEVLDYSTLDMVSGAGHDACNIAAVAPVSMIFVPCEGGLSHNEAEAITNQQAADGANVLLLAMTRRAGLAS